MKLLSRIEDFGLHILFKVLNDQGKINKIRETIKCQFSADSSGKGSL